jgi:hypothetical protein
LTWSATGITPDRSLHGRDDPGHVRGDGDGQR